jgi:heme/copper-type cytochrome/quinol oxidase subunit 3
MAVAAPTARHPVEPQPTYPGLSVGVMGMYIFLCSEVMFFGAMFAMYFYMFGSHGEWPPPGTQAVHWWPLPTINTVVLLSSGITCHFGLEALRHNGRIGLGKLFGGGIMAVGLVLMIVFSWLAYSGPEHAAGDALLGVAGAIVAVVAILGFLGIGLRGRGVFYVLWITTILLGVIFECGQAYEFLTAHINLRTNEFASAFFIMTGFHGAHVAGGLILLMLVLGRALRGQFTATHHVGPAAITLYWHFVDIVWIFLYGILYLAATYNAPTA